MLNLVLIFESLFVSVQNYPLTTVDSYCIKVEYDISLKMLQLREI